MLTEKEEVLKRILEDACATFSLRKLSERRNSYGAKFVIGPGEGGSRNNGPALCVGITALNTIQFSDIPFPLRDGIISFSSTTLRGFLEKFIVRELGHTTIPKEYLWPRRICLKRDRNIPGHHRWETSRNLNSSRPGYAVIVEYLEKTRYLPRGEELYHYLNSPKVRDACVALAMPDENPDEDYIGEYAKPIILEDRPPLGQIWRLVARALFTRGREPKRVPES